MRKFYIKLTKKKKDNFMKFGEKFTQGGNEKILW